jgi:hypothetical protein
VVLKGTGVSRSGASPALCSGSLRSSESQTGTSCSPRECRHARTRREPVRKGIRHLQRVGRHRGRSAPGSHRRRAGRRTSQAFGPFEIPAYARVPISRFIDEADILGALGPSSHRGLSEPSGELRVPGMLRRASASASVHGLKGSNLYISPLHPIGARVTLLDATPASHSRVDHHLGGSTCPSPTMRTCDHPQPSWWLR